VAVQQRREWRWVRWPDGGSRIGFGADYNPEQWPREVWADDVRLMRVAGVNIVSLAIFSWARLQPAGDSWDFGWLDEVMDLLHANGVAVDLATATASPPPWLTAAHPEILPVDRHGHTVWPGGRQHWRPTSPVFREHALRLVDAIANRYRDHPALASWHVSNELGCHNVWDHSEDAVRAFRGWLQRRYGDLTSLNDAWGTAFWSQHYGEWAEIHTPRLTATHPNPTQQLDFRRFSSDALKEYLCAERDVLNRITPDVPVTTNFMIMNSVEGLDYADWAGEVDFVANDHYLQPVANPFDELSFSANLTRGVAGGEPWFLMEHSTGAVNWQAINIAKSRGQLSRDSLTHLAHGADAICFFQWRQSVAGAEKYHSAMVPHAGPDTEVFRAVVDLGATLRDLAGVSGTRVVPARAGILFDWPSWWGSELDSHPSDRLRYRREAQEWYSAFLALGTRADVIPAGGSFSGYDVLVAPILYIIGPDTAARLESYVAAGGHLIVTYFCGIVDENDHAYLGGYPGALRNLLGVRAEEFAPLRDHERADLDNGTTATMWTEKLTLTDPATTALVNYASGVQAGRPAVTRRDVADGSATYVSTCLGPSGIASVLAPTLERAGVPAELPEQLRGRVEQLVRASDDAEYVFLINRTADVVELPALPERERIVRSQRDGAPGILRPYEVLVRCRDRRAGASPRDPLLS
jgi:beta-galactosidase